VNLKLLAELYWHAKRKLRKKVSPKNHSVHHKCHMTPPRMPDNQRGKPGPNHMRYGIAKERKTVLAENGDACVFFPV
jgi:hypothetical protein